jgi:hypothetical protein
MIRQRAARSPPEGEKIASSPQTIVATFGIPAGPIMFSPIIEVSGRASISFLGRISIAN